MSTAPFAGRTRDTWTGLTDAELLAQCSVDTYRASGPGGQKRNKTSSAVRLRHGPSGLAVIAEESRSQHENKARALRRLRQRLFLQLRRQFDPRQAAAFAGFAKWSKREPRFWPAIALALDALADQEGRVSEAADRLGVSTGQFVAFLAQEDSAFAAANQLRRQFGQKPLKAT
jgi:hypothetical protein